MDLLIHKINLSDEAIFDYETSINPNFAFIQKELKQELELYIQQNKKAWHKLYMRLKYFDNQTNRYLMIFIRPLKIFLSMKIWNVVGICYQDDWDEDMEEEGMIRSWLDTKINPNEDETDWVEELRFRKAEEERLRNIDERDGLKYERLFSN